VVPVTVGGNYWINCRSCLPGYSLVPTSPSSPTNPVPFCWSSISILYGSVTPSTLPISATLSTDNPTTSGASNLNFMADCETATVILLPSGNTVYCAVPNSGYWCDVENVDPCS